MRSQHSLHLQFKREKRGFLYLMHFQRNSSIRVQDTRRVREEIYELGIDMKSVKKDVFYKLFKNGPRRCSGLQN